jgi:hypothetical protein
MLVLLKTQLLLFIIAARKAATDEYGAPTQLNRPWSLLGVAPAVPAKNALVPPVKEGGIAEVCGPYVHPAPFHPASVVVPQLKAQLIPAINVTAPDVGSPAPP